MGNTQIETPDPPELIFDSCSDIKHITFETTAETLPGPRVVIASISGGKPDSVWDVTPAQFVLNIDPANSPEPEEPSAWELRGFFSPVNMEEENTVKRGQTVPLKFEVFADDIEKTSLADDIESLEVEQTIDCDLSKGTSTKDIMGESNLRYDDTEGQFVAKWKIPKPVGQCYEVTLTTSDGSTLSANFKTT